MTTLAKPLRAKLAEHFTVGRPHLSRDQTSLDGTRKWLLRFADGNEAETVLIPEEDRGTVCVSSQVGCTLTCKFCHTGTQKLVRNLTTAEIVAQVMTARDALGEWPTPSDGERLVSNIVLMGMGEPLFNYDNVAKAMRIIMDGEGISISKRRITLSTAGVVPMIRRCGDELGVNLAISLHATNDERARRDHADQQEISFGRAVRRPARIPDHQCASHHLRIRDAQGRQRQPRRGQGAGQAGRRACPPNSI